MAYVNLSGGFLFPFPFRVVGNPGFTNRLLDSANESVAVLCQVPSTGFVSKVGFRTSAVTTGGVVDVRIEGVATGTPSGILYQASANALYTIRDTDDNAWLTATLGSSTLVHAGSLISVQVKMNATSAGAINMPQLDNVFSGFYPYGARFLANAWTLSTTIFPMALQYADGRYIPWQGLYPVSAMSNLSVTTATAVADERGVAFSLPFPAILRGANASFDLVTNSGDLLLYDTDGATVLHRISVSNVDEQVAGESSRFYYFQDTVPLVVAGTYRMTMVPWPGATLDITELIGSDATVMSGFEGSPWFIGTARANSGSWTEDARVVPLFNAYLTHVDDGQSPAAGTSVVSAGVWGF